MHQVTTEINQVVEEQRNQIISTTPKEFEQCSRFPAAFEQIRPNRKQYVELSTFNMNEGDFGGQECVQLRKTVKCSEKTFSGHETRGQQLLTLNTICRERDQGKSMPVISHKCKMLGCNRFTTS